MLVRARCAKHHPVRQFTTPDVRFSEGVFGFAVRHFFPNDGYLKSIGIVRPAMTIARDAGFLSRLIVNRHRLF